jgi:hypothetical protein
MGAQTKLLCCTVDAGGDEALFLYSWQEGGQAKLLACTAGGGGGRQSSFLACTLGRGRLKKFPLACTAEI